MAHIAKLKNLHHLDVSARDLAHITKLKNLRSLSGRPLHVGGLTGLRYLDLWGEPVTGAGADLSTQT